MSSTSCIQIENAKATRLLFKGSCILLYFWHSNWHTFSRISEKVAKLHFSESPQESLKTREHSYRLTTHYEITTLLLLVLTFQNKNWWHFEFSMNQIFGQRFIVFGKLRYRGQLWLKLRAIEVATSFHWILSRST